MTQKYKKFHNKIYYYIRSFNDKEQMGIYIEMIRKLGYAARYVKSGTKYHVYERTPAQRKNN